MRILIILFILCFFQAIANAQNIGDLHSESLKIVFKIADSKKSDFTSEILNQIARDAGSCINTAFRGELKVSLAVEEIVSLSNAEENGIISAPAISYHRIGSAPAMKPLGRTSKIFEIILSDRVQITHVPLYLSPKVVEYFNSGTNLKRDLLLSQYSDRCTALKVCELNPEDLKDDVLRALFKSIAEIDNKFPSDEISQKASAIYMNSDEALASMFLGNPRYETATIIAHELMHAWGGLEDRYYEGVDKNNLMSGFVCRLDEEQIKRLKVNRGIQ